MRSTTLRWFQVWKEARKDRSADIPAPHAIALSPTEKRIVATTNLTLKALQDQHAKRSRPMRANLDRTLEQLSKVEEPAWDQVVHRTKRTQEDVTIGSFAHHLLMSAFVLGEGAFNAVAFAATGEPTIFSLMMAVPLTIAIPLLAYKAGVAARQYEPLKRQAIWVVSLTGAAAAGTWIVNTLRVSYLESQHIGDTATWVPTTLSYAVLNMIVFLAATIVTCLATDSDGAFVRAKKRFERQKTRVSRLRGELAQLQDRLVHQAEMIRQAGHQFIQFYRAVNRRGRSGVPAYFDDDAVRHHEPEFAEVHFDDTLDPPRAHAAEVIRRLPAAVDAINGEA